MREILDNIDAGVKAGLEKARKANTVEPLVGSVWIVTCTDCRLGEPQDSVAAVCATKEVALAFIRLVPPSRTKEFDCEEWEVMR